MATVLITGTNRGLGLEFVSQYVQRGDQVIATCRSIEIADELQQIRMEHSDLRLLEMDVMKQDSMERLANNLKGEAIDIFINNAGVYGPRQADFGEVVGRNWLAVLQVNSVAPLLLTQLLIDNFRRGKDRKLIYISSKMGSIDDNRGGGSYLYRSSKSALNQVVKSLSVDLVDEGFVAAVLHPGWALTDMGGPNAVIDPETSVRGMINVIDGLDASGSGKFYDYAGKVIAW